MPSDERMEIMEAIQDLVAVNNRKCNKKKRSNTITQFSGSRRKTLSGVSTDELQKYTPKEESAGIRLHDENAINEKTLIKSRRWRQEDSVNVNTKHGTLIGSCRAARIREDNGGIHFTDSFKINSLLKSSTSFKY